MQKICGNCSQELHGHYCSNCGQSAGTHKINFHFLWHDIQHGLLHFDKGIFYTTRELFTRPGHSIREFLEGKRVKHFRPISLVLVLAGIYGFLTHYFHINILANNVTVTGNNSQEVIETKKTVEKINEWFVTHYALIALVQIPIFALGTYLAFIKKGYNYLEHVIINTFLCGQRIILHIVFFPLYYLYNETEILKIVSRCVDFTGVLLFIWALVQLFYKRKAVKQQPII